jgi:20S proteasome alpha/beta subunit
MEQKLVSLREIFEGITPPEEPAEVEETEQEGIVEFTTREEYILCAVNCLNAVAENNTMTKADAERVKRVTRKCLKIIDHLSSEMYDELFDEDEED